MGMTETKPQPVEWEDMEEPQECEHCHEYFDTAHPDNWNSIPFYTLCPWCETRHYPEPDRYEEY